MRSRIPVAARAGVGCVAVLALHASQSRAQTQRDTLKAIPRELVEALLMPFGMGFGNATEFTVGAVPPSVAPFLYVPSGARVIGGLTTSNAVYVSMTSQSPVADVAVQYRREQPKLGWTVPTTPSRGWGFVPAPSATQDNQGLQFCHINQSLEIRSYPRPGGTQITATIQSYGSRCSPNSISFVSNSPAQNLLPTLENPVGAAMNSSSCYAPFLPSNGATSTTERLQTSLTPTQLLDGFAKQLGDSGWKATDPTGASVRRMWTRPDSGEVTREVSLQITPTQGNGTASGCEELLLSVRRIPRAP